MHEPTRFGEFLLLKKLSEDPLGEVYRAGRVQGTTVGEIVLLRIFSIPDLEGGPLVEAMEGYAASQAEVQGPGVVHFRSCGQVGGVAWVVYDYSSGWDLAALIKAVRGGYSELELDHAVLLIERMAKGLSQVHKLEDGARPFHGFLTPYTVRVTDEGEIQLLGFETGPLFAAFAHLGHLDPAVRPYLSPEVRAGGPASAQDDVYSLGALFFELLTGQPPAESASENLATTLAMANLASGEPMPAGLAELLQRCLAEARGRTNRIDVWYRLLTGWMGKQELKKTHFDLAFFIHELFRRQIQAEKEEIAKEKQIDLAPKPAPAPAPAPAARPTPVSGPVAVAAEPEPSASSLSGTYVGPPPKRSNPGLMIALAAVVIAAVALGIFMFTKEPPPPPPPPVTATPPPPPTSRGLDIAQEELARLVAERSDAVTEALQSEYDDQIRSLQEQIDQAREAEQEALQSLADDEPEPQKPADQPAATKPAPPTPPPPAEAVPPPPAETAKPAAQPTAPPVAPAKPATGAPAKPQPATPQPATPQPAAPQPATPQPATPAPAAPQPAASPPTATPPAAPPPPAEVASVPPPQPPPLEPQPAVIMPPDMLRMPDPIYPTQARRLNKQGTVLLKVLVGVDGSVKKIEPVSKNAVGYGFDQAATRAASGAVFKPGTKDGKPAEMWTTVVVSFRL